MSSPPSLHTIPITGMDCINCAQGIEKRLKEVGFPEAKVHFSTSSATIATTNSDMLRMAVQEIEKLGYKTSRTASSFFSTEKKFLVSALCTAPLLLHGVGPQVLHHPLVQLSLSLPPVLVGLLHFGQGALRSLRARFPTMDVLVVIGVIASFFYSIVGMFFLPGDHMLFFETAGSIVTFVLLGQILEQRSLHRATSAMQDLLKLKPLTAYRTSGSPPLETITAIDADDVQVGERLLVNTGDQIPCDGFVLLGSGWVDESMLTGESTLQNRPMGSDVFGGTILQQGSLTIEATQIGETTALSRIIRLMEETQDAKAPIQRLGDRISAVFVPIILLFSLCTLFFCWALLELPFDQALLRGIAVLVIACPCAMGIATPTAVMVGLGRAARLGILVKGGGTIENLSTIRTIAFDKTGTLTTGAMTVTSYTETDEAPSDIKAIIASIEKKSSHPIARSVNEAFSDAPTIEVLEFAEIRGRGVKGKTPDGRTIEIGSYEIAKTLTADRSPSVYVVVDEKLAATFSVSDQLRPEAKETIRILHQQGYATALLSGDSPERSHAVAEEVGISTLFSHQSPEEKVSSLKLLSLKGKVSFVGDGINDGPSLAAATVGISLSSASNVAISAAQVILLKPDLTLIPKALALGKATYRTIQQNLFWAFFYNILAVPLAAAGFLTPTLAAFVMAFSDVIVIGNSLLLKIRNIDNRLK